MSDYDPHAYKVAYDHEAGQELPQLSPEEAKKLIDKLLKGNTPEIRKEASEELYNRYRVIVLGGVNYALYGRKQTILLSRQQEKSDVVSVVWTSILADKTPVKGRPVISSYDPTRGYAFSSWLFGKAFSLTKTYLKKELRPGRKPDILSYNTGDSEELDPIKRGAEGGIVDPETKIPAGLNQLDNFAEKIKWEIVSKVLKKVIGSTDNLSDLQRAIFYRVIVNRLPEEKQNHAFEAIRQDWIEKGLEPPCENTFKSDYRRLCEKLRRIYTKKISEYGL